MLNYKELRQEFHRKRIERKKNRDRLFLCLILLYSLAIFFFCSCAMAFESKGVNIERLANAIYKAEGGNKTKHPYGILPKYRNTTPRMACINTIKSRLRVWNGKGDFISFLGQTYCPVGALNDPLGLNKNWIKNVRHFYTQQ